MSNGLGGLPSPLLPQLLNGLLGRHSPVGGNGPGNGLGEGVENDSDHGSQQARQAALAQERAAEAGNEQAPWQSNSAGSASQLGHGPHGAENSGPLGHGHFPNPGEVLSDALGRADGAARNLLGQSAGPNGSGLLGKAGDLPANILNQAANTAGGLAARTLQALPAANPAAAAGALLTQAAQMASAQGAEALAARSALHDAAVGTTMPSRDVAAPLQTAPSNPLTNMSVPGTSRAADAALIQGRQDMPLPMRAEQAAVNRSATVLPGSSPPPAAAVTTDAVRNVPFAATPASVPPSQSVALVEGRQPSLVGGNDRVGTVPKAADMAQQTPAGHTGAAPARVGRHDEEAGESLARRMVRALAAFLGMGASEAALREEEDALAPAVENPWQRLQWLFWTLAVAGYACLVVALIIFIPGGSGFLDESHNPLGTPALIVGLICSLGAWWLARKLAANILVPSKPAD